jgi:hypothetical protein
MRSQLTSTFRFEFSYSGEVTQVEPSVDALLGSEALSFLSFFSPTRMPPNTEPSTEVTCLRPGALSLSLSLSLLWTLAPAHA